MLSLILSTLFFFVAARYFKRYLDDMDIPQGMTRGILVFTLAMTVAWCAAAAINWIQADTKPSALLSAIKPAK